MIFSHILRALKNPVALAVWIISMLFLIFFWYLYSDVHYVAANYRSYLYAYTDVFLSWLVILLFPLILAGITYRSLHFGIRGAEKASGFFGVLSGIAGVFITGVACCGVSLISVLGLTSLITFLEIFPYHGLELKILSSILLAYAFYDLYSSLTVCKIKNKKR